MLQQETYKWLPLIDSEYEGYKILWCSPFYTGVYINLCITCLQNHSRCNMNLRVVVIEFWHDFTDYNYKWIWMLWGKNRRKWKRRQLPGVEPRTPLAWAASALPLSHDSRTTTNPHNPLCVVLNASVAHLAATQYVSLSLFLPHNIQIRIPAWGKMLSALITITWAWIVNEYNYQDYLQSKVSINYWKMTRLSSTTI